MKNTVFVILQCTFTACSYGAIDLDNDDYTVDLDNDNTVVDLDDSREEEAEYGLVDLSSAGGKEEDNIEAAKSTIGTCCSYRCTDYFTPIEVEQLQRLFTSKSQTDQQQFLLDQVTLADVHGTEYKDVTFQLHGCIVCKQAITDILHTSQTRLKHMFSMAMEGIVKVPVAKRKRGNSMKYTHAISWFDTYTHEFGEKMPHMEQIHLSVGQTKKSLYQTMKGTHHAPCMHCNK